MINHKCNSKIVKAGVAGATLLSAYLLLIRPRHLRWGATDEETRESLPGDELVPKAQTCATHAVTIKAPVSKVWPWLVQIRAGQGRLLQLLVARKPRRLPPAQCR